MNEIRDNYPDAQCAKCDQWEGRTSGHLWKKEWKKESKKEGNCVIKIY